MPKYSKVKSAKKSSTILGKFANRHVSVIGIARVSSEDQNLEHQQAVLLEKGVPYENILSHKGSAFNRHEIIESLEKLIFSSDSIQKVVVESTDRITRRPDKAWGFYTKLVNANKTFMIELISTNEIVDFVAQFRTKILPDIERGWEASAEKSKKMKLNHRQGRIGRRAPKPVDINIQYFQRCAAWGCFRNDKLINAAETWKVLHRKCGLNIGYSQILKWRHQYPQMGPDDFYKTRCDISGFMIPSDSQSDVEINYSLYEAYGFTIDNMRKMSEGDLVWEQNLVFIPSDDIEDNLLESDDDAEAGPADSSSITTCSIGTEEWDEMEDLSDSMGDVSVSSFQEDFSRLNESLANGHITQKEYISLIKWKTENLTK